MNTHTGVTLQIILAPTDLPHAKHIVPHQLRQWAGQVDDISFIVDLHRSRGRYSEGWKERLPGLRRLIDECCARYSHAHFRVAYPLLRVEFHEGLFTLNSEPQKLFPVTCMPSSQPPGFFHESRSQGAGGSVSSVLKG